MSKEMDNHSFNERHSLTGSSGLLGLTSLRPKMQPIRVKALLEMYGSDEEESEEKGRESDGESDCEDIQPLPDDDEDAGEVQKLPEKESSRKKADRSSPAQSEVADERFEEKREHRVNSQIQMKVQAPEDPYVEETLRRSSTFTSEEKSHVNFKLQRSSSLPFESENSGSYSGSSAAKHSNERNHGPNANFKPPEVLYSSTSKSSYSVTTKSECVVQGSSTKTKFEAAESAFFSNERHPHSNVASHPEVASTKNKFEAADSAFFSNERHSHSTNPASHPEVASTKNKFEAADSAFFPNERHSHSNASSHPEPAAVQASVQAQTSNHHITDTPHKHNPPVGSMRPTPSISHRSMFQTPCSEKLRPQDYAKNHGQTPRSEKLYPQDFAKNHGQTPATIFGNWSQRHMAQTPMQSRSSALPVDSSRSHVSQHPATAAPGTTAPGSTHETPWYRGTEEKKLRRPLGETMQSSTNHQRLSQSEKPAAHYATDSSAAKHHENPEHPQQGHGVVENAKEKSASKSAQQYHGVHETKENRHPAPLIEKLPVKEEEPGGRGNLESIKESVGLSSSGKSAGDNRQEAARHRNDGGEAPASWSVRSNCGRHPAPLIEKLPVKEEEQGGRGHLESVKESAGSSSGGKSAGDNRQEAARHRNEVGDAPAPWSARSNCTPAPKNAAPETVEKNGSASSQKANVQLSIPSSIRKVNRGETMVVKGKEYLILGTLGQGMSCYVLRVQDLTSLELRAIKVVNLSRMDKDSAQGCMQEISMLHKLQAPCVVRMFDYEIKYPMVHVVMEMGDTDFRSLLNSMSEKKRLPLTMILYYWTEMLTAVKHIHENGVIHSDLKPANFLLVRGRLKLIDFGIASSINADMTSVVKNSTIGTLNYISPEALMDIGGGGSGSDSPNQNVKYKITFKSDVWSLGCILYSLIYGYTPFNSIRSQWAKIQAITNPNPKISYALPPGNDVDPPPPILIEVLRKCLQHDPKARPTVTQLLQIPYITTKPNSRALLPDLPSNIVMKIRRSLTEDEWRQFTQIMEARRNHS